MYDPIFYPHGAKYMLFNVKRAISKMRQALGWIPPRLNQRREIAWRYLKGQGIEIGALHQPLHVPPRSVVKYVDRMSIPDLRRHYAEFKDLPLVPVDIIDDGETLASIAGNSQDFVIGNHLVEHCQNPIAAIYNWLRVLRPGGVLYLSVPDKRFSFDRDRPITALEHLVRDYEESPAWSRMEHFREWAQYVARVPEDKIEAKARKLLESDYSIHYHVWTALEFLQLIIHCRAVVRMGFELELVQQNGEEFIIVLIAH